MSRASVIVTKYNLDSYFYILQGLALIVPVTDKADDKNKKTVKKSSAQDQSPRPQKREKLMNHLRNSVSQDVSFSGDNENDDYDNYHPPSKRKRSEASTSISLDLFHDFLGKLDERSSVLESAIHQMPSRGKEREWAHQDGGSGVTVKSVIVRSELKGMPMDEDSSDRPAKIRRCDNCINTNSSFTLPSREDQAGSTSLYEIDPEAEEPALFGSRSSYSDVSSDDFSVTYRSNSPCTDQGRAKSFVDS